MNGLLKTCRVNFIPPGNNRIEHILKEFIAPLGLGQDGEDAADFQHRVDAVSMDDALRSLKLDDDQGEVKVERGGLDGNSPNEVDQQLNLQQRSHRLPVLPEVVDSGGYLASSSRTGMGNRGTTALALMVCLV